jgi:isoquinoline 1-oxidoreductase beta subunit
LGRYGGSQCPGLGSTFKSSPRRHREDDIHHAYFHALSVDHLEAGLDAEGKATSWRQRTFLLSIASLFMPDPKHKGESELGMSFNTMPFDIPAIRLENPPATAHVRIGWFRSVYNLPHAWVIQSFAPEMAVTAGKGHRDYVLDLLGPAWTCLGRPGKLTT